MRSVLFSLMAAAVLLGASIDGYAADFQLEGFTSTTFLGNQRVFGYTRACQSDFGADARMCTSVEVMETTDIPTIPLGVTAWVRPVYVPADSGDVRDASDVSTMSTDPVTGAGMSCNGWVAGVANFGGLTVDSNAAFDVSLCNSLKRVACCVPVDPFVATVPSLAPLGRGLLVTLMLSIAGGVFLARGRPALPGGRGRPTLDG